LRDTNELTRKKSLLYQFHMYTLKNNIEITNKTMVSRRTLTEMVRQVLIIPMPLGKIPSQTRQGTREERRDDPGYR
jgi:hypothetical protein